jgi:hypothetical protein
MTNSSVSIELWVDMLLLKPTRECSAPGHMQHGSLSTKGVRLEQAWQIADAENFKSISIRFFIRIGK